VDLQRELKVRGKKPAGLRKNQLVELLEKAIADESATGQGTKPPSTAVSVPEGKGEEEDSDVDLGFLEASDQSEAAKTDPQTKAPSMLTSSQTTQEKNTGAAPSLVVEERRKRAQRFGLSLRLDKSQNAKEARRERFGIVTHEDKKEARAEKFGVITQKKATELRQARAQRFTSNGTGAGPMSEKQANRLKKFGLPTPADTEARVAKRKQRFGELKSDSLATTNPVGNPIRKGGRALSRGTSNGRRGSRGGRGGRGGRGRRGRKQGGQS